MAFISGSVYEDLEAVARISSADLSLQADFDPWHQEILSNFYRVSGKILSRADKEKLRRERRPAFEWNLFLPIIVEIASNFKDSLPGLEFIGVHPQDHKTAVLQKQMSEFHLYQCNDIYYELAKAFLWAIIGRIGWLFQDYTFSDLRWPEGKVLIKFYDSIRIKFDRNWQRRDVSDLNYIDDTGWYSPEEICSTYATRDPAMKEEIEEKATMIMGESSMNQSSLKRMIVTWAERVMNLIIPYQGEKAGYDVPTGDLIFRNGEWYNGRGKFKIIDWYEKRPTPEMEIFDFATGEKQDITDQVRRQDIQPGYYGKNDWYDNDMLQQVKKDYIQPMVKEYRPQKIWQTSVCPGLNMKLYDSLQNIQSGYYKYIPIFCYDFHPDILETKSVVDHIKDLVESANLRRNTMLTYLMRMAHGGVLAEADAIKDYMGDYLNNEIAGIKRTKPGAVSQNRIKFIDPPPFPAALDAFVQEEIEALKMISTSTDNSRGVKESSKESGVLFNARVEQAELLQTWINNNAQASLVILAHNNIQFNKRYFKYPRALLLLQDMTDPYWLVINERALGQVINDPTVGNYIVKISPVPYGRLAKEKEFNKAVELSMLLMKINPLYVDAKLIVELSNLSVARRMIERINFIDQKEQAVLKQNEIRQSITDDMNYQKSMLEIENSKFQNKSQIQEATYEDMIMEQAGFQ